MDDTTNNPSGDALATDASADSNAARGKRSRNNLRFWCDICKIACASAVNLQTHFIGFRHKMVEEALKIHVFPTTTEKKSDNADEPENPENPDVRLPADVIKDLTRRPKKKFQGAVESLEEQLNNSTEPVIGLDYVIEYRSESDVPYMYECTICNCTTGMTNMFMHVVGYKHRFAYLQLKYPEMVGPAAPKTGYPRVLEKLKEKAAYIEKMEGRQSLQVVTVPDAKRKKKGTWLQDRLRELNFEISGCEPPAEPENVLQQLPQPDLDNIEDVFMGVWGGQPITQSNLKEDKKPKRIQESYEINKEDKITSVAEEHDSDERATPGDSRRNQNQSQKEAEKNKRQTTVLDENEGSDSDAESGGGRIPVVQRPARNQKRSNRGFKQQRDYNRGSNSQMPPPLMDQDFNEGFNQGFNEGFNSQIGFNEGFNSQIGFNEGFNSQMGFNEGFNRQMGFNRGFNPQSQAGNQQRSTHQPTFQAARSSQNPFIGKALNLEEVLAEQNRLMEQNELRMIREALMQNPSLMQEINSQVEASLNHESILKLLVNKAGFFSFLNNFEVVSEDDAAFVLSVTRSLTIALVGYRQKAKATSAEMLNPMGVAQVSNRRATPRGKKSKWDPAPPTPAALLAASVASRQSDSARFFSSGNRMELSSGRDTDSARRPGLKRKSPHPTGPVSSYSAAPVMYSKEPQRREPQRHEPQRREPQRREPQQRSPARQPAARPANQPAARQGNQPAARQGNQPAARQGNRPAARPGAPRKGNVPAPPAAPTDALMDALAKDGITSRFLNSLKGMNVSEVAEELSKIAATNPAFKGIHIPTVLKTLVDTGVLETHSTY